MSHRYSKHSLHERATLHEELVLVCDTLLPLHDFRIQEGHRNKERQNQLYADGASKLRWPASKHNSYPSRAMDLLPFVNGQFIGWDKWPQWRYFGGMVLGVAHALRESGQMQYELRWGHDWDMDNDLGNHRFVDGPHFELIGG